MLGIQGDGSRNAGWQGPRNAWDPGVMDLGVQGIIHPGVLGLGVQGIRDRGALGLGVKGIIHPGGLGLGWFRV